MIHDSFIKRINKNTKIAKINIQMDTYIKLLITNIMKKYYLLRFS